MRRGLSIHLINVALTDPAMEILADILARNNTIETVELPSNMITSKGAIALEQVNTPCHWDPFCTTPLLTIAASHLSFLFLRV
jgi:hypothetical protein